LSVTEIGLAVCASCGHGRSEHGHCSETFPAVCTHGFDTEDEGYYGVCTCMQFVTEADLA
jgi:hypothetical protein